VGQRGHRDEVRARRVRPGDAAGGGTDRGGRRALGGHARARLPAAAALVAAGTAGAARARGGVPGGDRRAVDDQRGVRRGHHRPGVGAGRDAGRPAAAGAGHPGRGRRGGGGGGRPAGAGPGRRRRGQRGSHPADRRPADRGRGAHRRPVHDCGTPAARRLRRAVADRVAVHGGRGRRAAGRGDPPGGRCRGHPGRRAAPVLAGRRPRRDSRVRAQLPAVQPRHRGDRGGLGGDRAQPDPGVRLPDRGGVPRRAGQPGRGGRRGAGRRVGPLLHAGRAPRRPSRPAAAAAAAAAVSRRTCPDPDRPAGPGRAR
jgi:hypothetical protein